MHDVTRSARNDPNQAQRLLESKVSDAVTPAANAAGKYPTDQPICTSTTRPSESPLLVVPPCQTMFTRIRMRVKK
jgi:hypothetical protein